MPFIRFTSRRTNEIERLAADSYPQAKRLYDYSVSCATSHTLIELVVGDKVIHQHEVVFDETIPSVRDMPHYSAK